MISERQFTDALTFVRSYKDALTCVEQIAERRAAYSHYEQFARSLTEGIQNKQIALDNNGHILPGASVADFPLVKQHAFAKNLWTQYGLASVNSREEFTQKLDKGIKELQAKNRK